MSELDYAALAAEVLKQKPIFRNERTLSRDRGITTVAQAMRELSRRKQRWRTWPLVALAAAAAVTGVFIASHRLLKVHSPGATACANCEADALKGRAATPSTAQDAVAHVEGRTILPGGVIESSTSHPSEIGFDSGTRLALAADTHLVYESGGVVQKLALSRGAVEAHVAKLGPQRRFIITTPDAEVEVHGTVFQVSWVAPSESCAVRTRVTVKEGVVEVRSGNEQHSLHAGDEWPSQCREKQKSEASPHQFRHYGAAGMPRQESHAHPDDPESASQVVNPNQPAAAPAEPGSALAIQNGLYARASSERNRGHTAQAVALYSELLSKFPDGALSESAYVQRMRILRTTDPGQARSEAQRYLQKFPKGYARSEAQGLLGGP